MNKERQALVTPVESTWDQLLKMWYEEEYQGKEFKEGTPLILTEKGERVRSKSEKILADYFYRNNIPYKYEKPLYLKRIWYRISRFHTIVEENLSGNLLGT